MAQLIENAQFFFRACAFLTDYLIVSGSVIALVFFILFAQQNVNNENLSKGELNLLAQIIFFTAFIGYNTIFECSKIQATPGKILMGLRIGTTSGNRVSLIRSIIRNAIKTAYLLLTMINTTLGFLVLLTVTASIIGTEKKQALHDIITGTEVIKKSKAIFSS